LKAKRPRPEPRTFQGLLGAARSVINSRFRRGGCPEPDAPSPGTEPQPVQIQEVDPDESGDAFIQSLADFKAGLPETATPAIQPTKNTAGAAVVDLEPAQRSYAATRGSAIPSQVMTFRAEAFSPGRIRPRGRTRRPSCNARTPGSRRSGSQSATSSTRSRSPSRDDPDPPGESDHLHVGLTP
jgi:hypothetical protein